MNLGVQAIAKGVVAYYQKYIDEASKKEIKEQVPHTFPRCKWDA